MCDKCQWENGLTLMDKLHASGKAPWGKWLLEDIMRKVQIQKHMTPKQLSVARMIEQKAGIKTRGDYDV